MGSELTLTRGQYLKLTSPEQKVYHSTRLSQANTMVPKSLLCGHFLRNYLPKTKPYLGLFDFTSEVTGWPGTLKSGINRSALKRRTRLFFPRGSSSIRGETAKRGRTNPPPSAGRGGGGPTIGPARVKQPHFVFSMFACHWDQQLNHK